CSILEAFARVEALTGRKMRSEYLDAPRVGDHRCYITNLAKLKCHYPEWDVTRSLDDIFVEIVEAWRRRPATVQTAAFKKVVSAPDRRIIERLATREEFRTRYWERNDPIVDDRLLWRAQTLRHMVHLLPGQTNLEDGCGSGRVTTPLARVSRADTPVAAETSATA